MRTFLRFWSAIGPHWTQKVGNFPYSADNASINMRIPPSSWNIRCSSDTILMEVKPLVKTLDKNGNKEVDEDIRVKVFNFAQCTFSLLSPHLLIIWSALEPKTGPHLVGIFTILAK